MPFCHPLRRIKDIASNIAFKKRVQRHLGINGSDLCLDICQLVELSRDCLSLENGHSLEVDRPSDGGLRKSTEVRADDSCDLWVAADGSRSQRMTIG